MPSGSLVFKVPSYFLTLDKENEKVTVIDVSRFINLINSLAELDPWGQFITRYSVWII